jgi:hypothetical protein
MPVLVYYSEHPRALKNYSKSSLPALCKWNDKTWMTANLFTTWFAESLKPISRPISHKKDSFQKILAH